MLMFMLGSYAKMLVYLGFFKGCWTLFVIIAAELNNTNFRACVATTVPNFVRASIILISALLLIARGGWGITNGATAVRTLVMAISLLALWCLEETFTKDLNYVEKDVPELDVPEIRPFRRAAKLLR